MVNEHSDRFSGSTLTVAQMFVSDITNTLKLKLIYFYVVYAVILNILYQPSQAASVSYEYVHE